MKTDHLEGFYNRYIKGTLIGDIVEFIYKILGSEWIQIAVNIGFTIYIGYHFAQQDSKIDSTFVWHCVFYFIVELIFAYINGRRKRKRQWDKILVDCGRDLWKIQTRRAQNLSSVIKNYIDDGIQIVTNVQDSGNAICDALLHAFNSFLKSENFEIVLFQQFGDNINTYARPIAFANNDNSIPKCMNKYYYDFEDVYKIVDVFTNSAYIYYENGEEVKSNFTYKDPNAREQEIIKQYLAVPISTREVETLAALQISAFEEGMLPKKKYINEIISDIIAIFTVHFQLCLEEQNLVETLTN